MFSGGVNAQRRFFVLSPTWTNRKQPRGVKSSLGARFSWDSGNRKPISRVAFETILPGEARKSLGTNGPGGRREDVAVNFNGPEIVCTEQWGGFMSTNR